MWNKIFTVGKQNKNFNGRLYIFGKSVAYGSVSAAERRSMNTMNFE